MTKPIMVVVRDTYREWSSLMKSIALDSGIPESYRIILTYLLRHPGANQKDLAEYRGITTSSISQTLKEMMLTGYLKKETDENDKRFTQLYLTEKGMAAAEKLHARVHAADEKLIKLLTPEREAEFLSMLGEISRIIREELPRC